MTATAKSPSNLVRLLVTLGVVAVYFAGKTILLPGLAPSDLPVEDDLIMRLFGFDNSSIGALGAGPLWSAFLLVELAALVIPPWRELRNGSLSGRQRLQKAALVVALLATAVQGYALSVVLDSSSGRTLLLGSFLGWTALLWLMARGAERFGALGGFQSILLADLSYSLLRWGAHVEDPAIQRELLFLLALTCVAIVGLAGPSWRPLTHPSSPAEAARPSRTVLPWLVVGFLPLQLGRSSLQLPHIIGRLSDGAPRLLDLQFEYPWWTLLTVAGATFLLAGPLYGRQRLRLLDGMLGQAPRSPTSERSRLGHARNLSLLFLLPVWAVSLWLWRDADVDLQITQPFVLVAMALDGFAHLRFRASWPDAVSVYQCNYVHWATHLRDALAAAGIRAHLTGLRHRTLTQLFAPYVPIHVLVPAADAVVARELLASLALHGLPAASYEDDEDVPGAAATDSKPQRPPFAIAPWLWGVASILLAGYVVAHDWQPQPVWRPIPADTLALYAVDDEQSAFTEEQVEDCEGTELRPYLSPSMEKRFTVHAGTFEDLSACVRPPLTFSLPKGRTILFEPVMVERPNDANVMELQLEGWQTLLVHEKPLLKSAAFQGFSVDATGEGKLRLRDPKQLARATQDLVNRRGALAFRNQVIAAPLFQSVLTAQDWTLPPVEAELLQVLFGDDDD